MQLSAANLLVAAQQIARQVQQPNAKAFSAALASEADDLFAPLDFKQTAGVSAPRPASSQSAPSRMGTQLDIRI
jgi:hypothetical protein